MSGGLPTRLVAWRRPPAHYAGEGQPLNRLSLAKTGRSLDRHPALVSRGVEARRAVGPTSKMPVLMLRRKPGIYLDWVLVAAAATVACSTPFAAETATDAGSETTVAAGSAGTAGSG